MVEETLILTSFATGAVASAYMAVGLRLGLQPRGDAAADRALRFFSAWWIATSVNQFLASSLYLAAGLGYVDLGASLTYALVQRLLLSVSLVGLMYYLLYLLRGDGHLRALMLAYGGFYAFQVYTILAGTPVGVELYRWRTDLAYATPGPAWWPLVNLVFIVLPPVVACGTLLGLFHRVPERSRRVRLVTVAGGIMVWWIIAVVAGQRALLDVDALQVANRAIGLAVAVSILLVYQPTGWLQRRLAIAPYPAAP